MKGAERNLDIDPKNALQGIDAELATGVLDDDSRFVLTNLRERVGTEHTIQAEGKEGQFVPRFSLLVISGKGSVGNTTTADYAADMYGIPRERVYHAGEKFREYRDETGKDGHESVEFIERPEHLDKIIDEWVLEKLLEATPENPIIVEAKLGGVLLRFIEQQARARGIALPTPRAAILKWADSKKRAEIASKKEGTEVLSSREIKKQSSDRDRRDREQWGLVHPWLNGFTNILDKNARDNEGNPLYQDFVDASDHSGPEDDFGDLNEKLVRLGLVVEIPQQMQEGQPAFLKGYEPDDYDQN